MTQVVVLDPQSILSFSGSGSVVSVDISGFSESDFISIALPDFPYSKINLAQSFVDFTSNAEGDFDAGLTNRIAFNLSSVALVEGNCELRIPLSLLNTIDKSSVTGVQFRVVATDTCNFRAMAIRCVSADWVYAPLDLNTLYNQVRRSQSPNGALYANSQFPANETAGLPTQWPIIFRSDEPSSSKDPMPIDLSIGSMFNSGSLTSATGDIDLAARFVEGSNISIPTHSSLNFSSSFTIECWVKPSDLNESPIGIITKWNDATDKKGYRVGINTSGQILFDWTTDGNTAQRAISTGASIAANQWSHIVVTYNSSAGLINFYHNGEIAGSASHSVSTPVASTDRPFKIGAWITG